jgi:uncharacterized protein (DUF3820 family)
MEQSPDPQILLDIVSKQMPFGKYKGYSYDRIPVNYLEWMKREGFPPGRVGVILATVYEIKLNGLEFLLKELRNRYPR